MAEITVGQKSVAGGVRVAGFGAPTGVIGDRLGADAILSDGGRLAEAGVGGDGNIGRAVAIAGVGDGG